MNCKEAGKLGAIARNKNLTAKRRKEISELANLKKAELSNRCKQCKIENNRGVCDRSDCSLAAKKLKALSNKG